jgi:hypothetical protein
MSALSLYIHNLRTAIIKYRKTVIFDRNGHKEICSFLLLYTQMGQKTLWTGSLNVLHIYLNIQVITQKSDIIQIIHYRLKLLSQQVIYVGLEALVARQSSTFWCGPLKILFTKSFFWQLQNGRVLWIDTV